MTGSQPVALAPVRRWVRARQNAHRDTGSLLGNVYFGVLLVAVLLGMVWPMISSVFWPDAPSGAVLRAVAIPLISVGVLHLALRRLGPLAVSRPAASWLLTAPVRRRALLAPAARIVMGISAAAGAAIGFAVVSQVTARPAPGGAIAFGTLDGALVGVAVALGATAAQRRAGWARAADLIAYGATGLGAVVLVADRTSGQPAAGLRAAPAPIGYAAAGLAAAVAVLGAIAYRRLDRTHPETILAAAQATGTMADATTVGQPSFVADLFERRYWARRRWRSRPFAGWLPVLTGQDLRVLGRKPQRLGWLAAAALVPAVFTGSTGLLPAATVLFGAMFAAATTTTAVRTDAANPALLRLLAVSARQAVLDRAWLPALLASLWSGTALLLLTLLHAMPSGPWWALGLALGPAAAAGAIRRARMGLVPNGLLPLDTPMGSVETGPVLGAVIGYDLLLVFGLPTLVLVGTGDPLSWSGVLTQLACSTGGLALYVAASTSTIDADLKTR
jgi:hypothetical protein